jgi:hypothetical protein
MAASCVQQRSFLDKAEATIQLAMEEPESWTRVATCNISLAWEQATVNTFDHKYFDSISTPVQTSPELTSQLLNLTIESFVNFFHEGPPGPPSSKFCPTPLMG